MVGWVDNWRHLGHTSTSLSRSHFPFGENSNIILRSTNNSFWARDVFCVVIDVQPGCKALQVVEKIMPITSLIPHA
jgi:hypothetical protein